MESFCHTYKIKIDTRITHITIVEKNGEITNLLFDNSACINAKIKETETIKNAYTQIIEYLKGKRKTFDIKLNPEGTSFQKRVWNTLLKIPYGSTKSYKDVAVMIGNSNASRAVGMANNKNPIPIVIPCHRVIGSNGKLTGYALGLDVKLKLLNIEGITII